MTKLYLLEATISFLTIFDLQNGQNYGAEKASQIMIR